jgi:phage-related protein
MADDEKSEKPLFWVGRSDQAVRDFPREVRRTFGFALGLAQIGGKFIDSKPLKGFGGAGVLEIVEDFHRDTYRCVYTVKFAGAVYVLHAFQKKSKSGIKTPKQEIDLVNDRLKRAQEHYRAWLEKRKEQKL